MFDWLLAHEQNVQASITSLISGRYAALGIKLNRCQSPIQKILLTYLEDKWWYEGKSYFSDRPKVNIEFEPEVKVPSLDPTVSHRRPDIVATITYPQEEREPRVMKYVIECDGHKDHSSKDDMNRDYKRTRELEMLGFHVLRYTGSEIVRNPAGCAEEFFVIVAQKGY